MRPRPGRARGRHWDLAVSIAALALGAPGCAGLALGWPLADWPIPLRPQLGGEAALKTVVYLSGLLFASGAIGLAWRLFESGGSGDAEALAPPPLTRGGGRRAGDAGAVPERAGNDESDGTVPLAEPFYGFLPRDVQLRLARDTGYQALLYTRISILIMAMIGVLLAGSWEAPAASEPIPPDATLRIGAGLYLMAESVRRYIAFARGEPSGTLVGTLVHGALRPLRGIGRGRE